MGKLLRRRLRCHGCGETSPTERAGIPRAWVCPYCEAVNHVDERGQITDPPVELTAQVQPLHIHTQQRARSPTPDMFAPVESPFCERCQKNHLIVNKALAEYLPDEDDPEYRSYEASLPQYQAQMEERYPPVCDKCLERVQQSIRQAGYAAKADVLRRKLDQSKKYQTNTRTARQFWTLLFVQLGKWTYISSVIISLLWHGFGAIALFDYDDREFHWILCGLEALFEGEVHRSCIVSSTVREVVSYALLADLLTIWWNSKLAQKVNHAHGRMRGLFKLWLLRIIVLVSNILGFLILKDTAVLKHGTLDEDRVNFYHYTHMVLFTTSLLGAFAGWRTVTIRYVSTKEFFRPLDAHLPEGPRSGTKPPRSQNKLVLPDNTSFDSMAEGFASNFPSELNAYPPSPTLTAVSVATTADSDFATPLGRKSSAAFPKDENAMDWTPTQPRFNSNPPTLIHPTFTSPQKPTPASPPPTRLFHTGPDPNPFRRRIPAAPKAPATAHADPWRKGVWAPLPAERKRNFFEEDKAQNEDLGMGLRGAGVPRTVEREAELFQAPRFKYDSYTGTRETGLEEGFNDLFSK